MKLEDINYKFIGESIRLFFLAVAVIGLMFQGINLVMGLPIDLAFSFSMSFFMAGILTVLYLMIHKMGRINQERFEDMINNPEDLKSYWLESDKYNYYILGKYSETHNGFYCITKKFEKVFIKKEDANIVAKAK